MKKNLLSFIGAAVLGMMSLSASAATLDYSYAQSEEIYQWGLKTPQTYDIAIELDASFAGMKVNAISVPVTMTSNINDFKVWMTTELAIDEVEGQKVNRTNIMCADVEPVEAGDSWGTLSYTLSEPYTVPANGLYVGYSFTVTTKSTDYEQYPILVSTPGEAGGLFVHSTKTYRAWKDRALEVGAVSTLVVTLEADIAENAVGLSAPSDVVAQAGQVRTIAVTVANHGSKEVGKIGYTVKVGETTSEGEYIFEEPIANIFNRAATAMVELPAVEKGLYDYALKITTVNGQPNGEDAVAEGKVNVLDILPTKRPLMEEYTGLWCGWCPRGWIAMEKMSEFHPEFVSIAYHNGDDMQISTYPAMESGYPSAFMDRSIKCDPYYGEPEKEFGIEALWEKMCLEFAPAEINLEAYMSEDGQSVIVNSDVCWAVDPGQGTYKVEYVLVGDGLSDTKWIQSNYYSSYTAASAGIYMDIFCKGGEYGKSSVSGLIYNDVALINTGGRGVAGSISSTATGSHSYYTHTFDLSKSKVIDKAQTLRVVAMVLKDNGSFGTVLNSNKAEVQTEITGVNTVINNADIVSTKYYDLTGREVANPANGGLYLRSVRFSDGRVETVKILK